MNEESDINYLIGGLIFGGIISAPVAYLIPWSIPWIRFGICGIGCIAGLCCGYAFAWWVNHRRRKRLASAIERSNKLAPPKTPTQIAGKICAGCAEGIVFAADGSFCKDCFAPYCVDCKEIASTCKACDRPQSV